MIEKLKNGDQDAFDEMYRRCYGHIYFLCSKFCANKEDAEEVVQDTFVIAFNKVDKLQGDTLMAYLRKIAVNLCYHKRKKNLRQQEGNIPLDEQVENNPELDEDVLPEEYLQNKERHKELLSVIEGLPTKQREVVYLYYYTDFNTEEIAQMHDCSAGYVRKALFQARSTIKTKLESSEKRMA